MRPQSVLTAPPQAAEQRSSHDHGGGRPRAEGRFDLTVLLAKTGFTHHQLCRAVHANGKVVANAITNGASPEQADRWAVRCGWHPGEVWADLWWDGQATQMHHPLIVTIGWGLLARRATPAGISFRDVIDAFGTPEKHS